MIFPIQRPGLMVEGSTEVVLGGNELEETAEGCETKCNAGVSIAAALTGLESEPGHLLDTGPWVLTFPSDRSGISLPQILQSPLLVVDAVFGMAIEGKFWQVDADADPEKQQMAVLEYRTDESGGRSRLKAHKAIKQM